MHLICTGSLTNAALLLILFPEVKAALAGITIMGGCTGTGNIPSPVAEFNIYTDPEAAKIVFHCGLPVRLVPLEVTHTALPPADFSQRLAEAAEASPVMEAVQDILGFFAQASFVFSSFPFLECSVFFFFLFFFSSFVLFFLSSFLSSGREFISCLCAADLQGRVQVH